ncbi:prepilin-type N-terminal cleavage/methylation domain-containing protein, partial [candidate division TA06 bacterium]
MVRGSRGFTMIELMVVIGIIGVMTAISIPFYIGYRPKLLLNQASNKVLASVRLARAAAVAEARPHTIYFSWDNEAYKMDDGPWIPLGLRVDMAKGAGWTEDFLSFSPDGKASTSGRIVFSSTAIQEEFELYVSIAGFTRLR